MPQTLAGLTPAETFGCQVLPTAQRPAPQERLAAGHHRMNTCSKTGKARRGRAWVMMDKVDRKKGKGKEEKCDPS